MHELYKQDNTGKTRVWWAEIDGNKYRLCAGIKGGQTVFSEWTVCSPKNFGKKNVLTSHEQAHAEVFAHYKKKEKKGYTKDENKVAEVKEALIKPMLAHDFTNLPECPSWPVFTQPKLDGIRCIARADGLWSRKGEPINTVPHIANAAIAFCKQHDVILDGELYNHSLKEDFNQICSLVRRTKIDPKRIVEIRDLVEYHVYDIMDEKLTFDKRMTKLIEIIPEFDREIKIVPTHTAKNRKELDMWYEIYLNGGYEGQMVRTNNYYQRKRTNSLLKRKEFQDEEFKIIDILEGNGNRSKMVGSCVFELPEGKTFNAALMGSNEYRKQVLSSRNDYIGRLATVKYFRKTPDGIPRFPVVKAILEA